MALSTRLDLRQGQQLVMTPQLQQAIKLLQLSNMELAQYVETELERNPLLEREDGEERPVAEVAESAGGDDTDYEPPALDLSKPAAESAASTFDTDHDNIYPDDTRGDMARDMSSDWKSVTPSTSSSANFSDDVSSLEAYVAEDVTLKDHLMQQMQVAVTPPVERIVAQHLIDLIDEAGYLHGDVDGLADKLGVSTAMVARLLQVIQGFDPTGVAARSLSECLALQLKEQNRFDPLMESLIDNLGLLASHNIAALRKAVGCDAEDLADMVHELKQLNPKPGLKFGSVQVQPVVPDVIVRAARDGSWVVELNTDTLPRVLVNRSYYTMVSKHSRNDKDKGYLTECLASANWLVKSLDQRARTILRVAEEIVRQQDGFLTHGVQHMRPLNLKTIAEKISMHESTVSRVTSNKYVQTPRGIFELKFFFTSSINATGGEGDALSSEAVRHRIRVLIDAESATGVLSDDRLVDQLKADGIDIARRTVAKYREGMRIASSVQRRREKQLQSKLQRRPVAAE